MGLAVAVTFFAITKITRGGERGCELPHFSPKKSFTVNSITFERLVVPGPYFRVRRGGQPRRSPGVDHAHFWSKT